MKIKLPGCAVCDASGRHVERVFDWVKPQLADALPDAGTLQAAYINTEGDKMSSGSPPLYFRAQKSALVGEYMPQRIVERMIERSHLLL